MSTLLIRLSAPLQSWGTDSRFDIRRTNREPSKSGVVGLIAAALGYTREQDEEIKQLAELRFGVRVDREGVIIRDYQTAKSKKSSWVTHRYYLADALFVAGVESEDKELLRSIDYALSHPAFPLYLGRRSCPPTGKLSLGVMDLPLETALRTFPMQCDKIKTVRLVLDADGDECNGQSRDVPISFNPEHRQFTYRNVTEKIYLAGNGSKEHDPMMELG